MTVAPTPTMTPRGADPAAPPEPSPALDAPRDPSPVVDAAPEPVATPEARSGRWWERRAQIRRLVGGCPDHWWNETAPRTAACTCDRFEPAAKSR